MAEFEIVKLGLDPEELNKVYEHARILNGPTVGLRLSKTGESEKYYSDRKDEKESEKK
jgi:hypothetical protein